MRTFLFVVNKKNGKRKKIIRKRKESLQIRSCGVRQAEKRRNTTTDTVGSDLVQVGGVAERLTALKAGALDGVLLAPDQRFQAEKMGFHAVIELSKLGIEYPLNGIVTRGQFLRTNRDTAKRFLRAWSEGIRILKTDRNFSSKVLGRYLRVDDPEVLR